MREVALAYKELIVSAGIDIEPSSFEQLLLIIRKVMDSWHSAKARTYRKIMGISDDWGTAVTIQNMVFGNRSELSGSGVFFTHDPRWSGDFLRLWGDFTIENQGEDVVSGLVQTLPISRKQRDFEKRETDVFLYYTQLLDVVETIRVPAGFTAGDLPESEEVDETYGYWKGSTEMKDGDLIIRSRAEVRRRQIPPDGYGGFAKAMGEARKWGEALYRLEGEEDGQ